jgi:hypothetical protein
VPVIAGAALVGGMIGGFAIYAIDSALTWEPVPQPRPDARAEGQASAVVAQPQTTKPVRIVGGAIPDPSAGMSAPPPAPQRSATSPAQISPQLLTPKPLGPASQLQPQTATAGPTVGAPQPQNQTANQGQAPTQAPAQAATTTQQQSRWPDALSRAHQNPANAANTNSAPQQTAPPPAAGQASERAASKNGDADRKQTSGDRAATLDDQDRGNTRHGRYSRRHWRGDNNVSASVSSSRRQDARSYDRLYDSYGNRRDRSYSNPREQFNGDARGDRDDAASRSDLSRSEMRLLGRDTRYRGQPEDSDRNQAFEAGRPRPEPFWRGGRFRRGDRYQDDD